MDPNNLQASAPTRDKMSVTHVQRWVMSILAVVTVGHFCAGLLVGAAVVNHDRPDAQTVFLVLGALTGVLAVAAGRAIHQASILTPWLLVGLLPAVVATFLVF